MCLCGTKLSRAVNLHLSRSESNQRKIRVIQSETISTSSCFFFVFILLLSYCLKVCDTITYFWKNTHFRTSLFCFISFFCLHPTSITLLETLFFKVNFTNKHSQMYNYLFFKLSYLGRPHLGINFYFRQAYYFCLGKSSKNKCDTCLRPP